MATETRKGSIETRADETAWEEALSGRGQRKESEHVRVKCPEKGLCACLACLVTPTFPFSLPLTAAPLVLRPPYPAPNSVLSSHSLSFLSHIFILRGLAASRPLFLNFQLSRSSCVVRLIKGPFPPGESSMLITYPPHSFAERVTLLM
jgi:hypothetical protein